ncbi:hypothetical protein BKA67DRAFT_669863, partial [Truncatella angustata]
HLNGVSSFILCLPELLHRKLCVVKPPLSFLSGFEDPFLLEPCPLSIWVKYLGCIVRWRKVRIFGESILPIQLLVVVVLLTLRPCSICAPLKVLPYKVIIVFGIDCIIMLFCFIYFSEKAVQG